MNAEQKQQAIALVKAWGKTAYGMHADAMAALLQEMVDAHEPKPVARVTGYYAGYLSIATVDGSVLPAGTALYAAPPAPKLSDERIMEIYQDFLLDKTVRNRIQSVIFMARAIEREILGGEA